MNVYLPMVMTRDELLAALAKKRKEAEKVDAANLRKHQAAERRYLASFKKACRKAATWDYETAKAAHFDPRTIMPKDEEANRWRSAPSAPSCPRSEVSIVDRFIAQVERLNQPRFTISSNGKWSEIYRLLDDSPRAKGLC